MIVCSDINSEGKNKLLHIKSPITILDPEGICNPLDSASISLEKRAEAC